VRKSKAIVFQKGGKILNFYILSENYGRALKSEETKSKGKKESRVKFTSQVMSEKYG